MLNTGVGSAYNVLDVFERGSTELVAVVDMLHMLAYAQQGALLTTLRQGPRKLLPLLPNVFGHDGTVERKGCAPENAKLIYNLYIFFHLPSGKLT